MKLSPAHYHATTHPWGFFVTLTFAGKVPTPALAYALQSRWLDRLPPLLRVNRANLGWLSREELGESNGRLHLHVLLSEANDERMNTRTCLAMMSEWEKVTQKALGTAAMARCRIFQPDLRGAEYVLKGLSDVKDWSLRGANTYELGKFDGSLGRTVRLARCLLVSWGDEKGNKYGQQARCRRDGCNVKLRVLL